MSTKHKQSSLAKAMLYIAITLFIALSLYYLFDKQLKQQHNPNSRPSSTQSNSVREITLQRNKWGHYVSSGKINEYDVVFFLDTGATDVSIPEHIAKKIGLKRGAAFQVNTANGSITVYATTLASVSLGNIEVNNVKASINPHMKELEFSQRNDQLTIRQYLPQ